MPDPTTPIEEIYFGGLLPEVVVRPKEVKGNWNDPMLDDSSYYNQRKRKEEVENFARQLFTEQRGSIDDRMQEYRDDPTNPLAYTPDADFSSIGYHLDKGNYEDAALYAGFAALPGAAGPIVNRVKPYLNKFKKLFKRRNIPSEELAQKLAQQEEAHKSGVDFAERWAYDLNQPNQPLRESYLQKTLETKYRNKPNAGYLDDADIEEAAAQKAQTLLAFAKNEMPPNYVGAVPSKNSIEKLQYPTGPMAKTENILSIWPDELSVNLKNQDLLHDFSLSGIADDVNKYMDNGYVHGFKTYASNPKPGFETAAVTFRKLPYEINLRDPKLIKNTGAHEAGHSQQQILEWKRQLQNSMDSNPDPKNNPLAYRIRSAMKDEGDWYSRIGELHSELLVSRMEYAEDLIKQGKFKTIDDAIDFMQTPEFLNNDENIQKLYDGLGGKNKNLLSSHGDEFFKKETSKQERLDIIKILPAILAGSIIGNQTLKEEPEQFQEGGEVTDPEDTFANALQSRQPYRDDYMNKLLKYAEPGDDTYMRIEDAFADKFNTELTPIEKIHYKLWLEAGFGNPRDIGVYDLQGYWKSGQWKNNTDPDNHGSDEFKKPNHPTFSAESKYSKQKGGSEYIGGVWREDGGFMAGPHNFYDNDALMWEFNREPNRPEYLYMGLPAVTVNGSDK